MQETFFDHLPKEPVTLSEGAILLPGMALNLDANIPSLLNLIQAASPFRNMITPGGHTMSVAMTNCGKFGWVTDKTGYRYDPVDPLTNQPWPAMPASFLEIAIGAAVAAGYPEFQPDACLINRYLPGSKLSLHQDRNEADFTHPIVSVSLGLPASFLFGGLKRKDAVKKYTLEHGDVVVWGGPSRLRFHGVNTLKMGEHPVLGEQRINLTFRKVV
ncbi:DNA oxidative demethylase AlkB [uncultured Roseobacter sp.]|uniref:DNA oxidative demethylase AlkB n=1 Tax=uncultured Roseobacter sp. TaxID=114847 RepID=UPI0026348805|nr:DNA oxidative demethylase AlkB [uncultured Roseobacter sp.]